jgi:peptide/nickel transport system permease protein
MWAYILKRLGSAVATFFGITILVYAVISLMPGDPVDFLIQDPNVSEEELNRRRIELGLNDSVPIQYLRWMSQLLRGNFGSSFRTFRPVSHTLFPDLKNTLILTGSSLALTIFISLILGLVSAIKPGSVWDRAIAFLSFSTNSFPGFFAGLIAIYIFCVKLRLVPLGGMYEDLSRRTVGDFLRHLILPASLLAFLQIGNLTRQVRNNMLEILGSEYIRTAQAKGLSFGAVILRHALRNAWIPVITMVSLSLPFLIGGSIVTEQLFSWPGIGTLLLTSIYSRDYPMLMGITVVVASTVLIMNVIVDLLYCLLDPRIRVTR